MLTIRVPGPIQFINKLKETWELNDNDMVTLLGYEPQQVLSLLSGRLTPRGRDLKDRIATLFKTRSLLHTLLRDKSVELEWLRRPLSVLGDKAPIDFMREGSSLESLIIVREYVEYLSRT